MHCFCLIRLIERVINTQCCIIMSSWVKAISMKMHAICWFYSCYLLLLFIAWGQHITKHCFFVLHCLVFSVICLFLCISACCNKIAPLWDNFFTWLDLTWDSRLKYFSVRAPIHHFCTLTISCFFIKWANSCSEKRTQYNKCLLSISTTRWW